VRGRRDGCPLELGAERAVYTHKKNIVRKKKKEKEKEKN
jgi:hypothetical protein